MTSTPTDDRPGTDLADERPAFIDARRRGLLQGVAAAAAGASVASGAAQADTIEPVATPVDAPDAQGYRLTDHVREYYAKARF